MCVHVRNRLFAYNDCIDLNKQCLCLWTDGKIIRYISTYTESIMIWNSKHKNTKWLSYGYERETRRHQTFWIYIYIYTLNIAKLSRIFGTNHFEFAVLTIHFDIRTIFENFFSHVARDSNHTPTVHRSIHRYSCPTFSHSNDTFCVRNIYVPVCDEPVENEYKNAIFMRLHNGYPMVDEKKSKSIIVLNVNGSFGN